MLLDNLWDIFRFNSAVKRPLWINHHHRALIAQAETARLYNSDLVLQVLSLQLILKQTG
jgi:hypothetical protein